MGRPRSAHVKTTLEVGVSPTMLEYIDKLIAVEGFGDTRAEVVRGFVWNEINRLLAVGRLKPPGASHG